MSLDRKNISAPFVQGVDTKTDPKIAVKPSRVEGMSFAKGGTLTKRQGTAALSAATDGPAMGTSLFWPLYDIAETAPVETTGEALFPFGNELVRINGGVTASLAQGSSTWLTKPGGGHYATTTAQRIVRNNRSQLDFDQASVNGITVIAWYESPGNISGSIYAGVHILVMDEATGAIYQNGNLPIASVFRHAPDGTVSGSSPRCVVLGGKVLVVYLTLAGGLAICAAVVDTANPGILPIQRGVGVTADAGMTGFVGLDAVAFGGRAIVAYGASASTVGLFTLDANGALLSSPAPTTVANSLDTSAFAVACKVDSNGVLYVVAMGSATTKYFCANPSTLAVTLAPISIGAVPDTAPALVEASPGTMTFVATCLPSAVGSGGARIQKAILGPAHVNTALANIPGTNNQMLVVSDAFVFDGVPMVLVGDFNRTSNNSNFDTTEQTVWLMDLNGNAVAKFLPGLASSGNIRLGRPVIFGNTLKLLVAEQGRLTFSSASGQTANVTTIGITRVSVTLTKASALPSATLGRAQYVGGSLPRVYDGQTVTETGLAYIPGGLSVSLGAGGNLSAGQYQWKALYSWLSAAGELVRSPASPPVTATATSTQAGTVSIPILPLSSRDSAAINSPVQIEVYRTTANGTVFYRASQPTAVDSESGLTVTPILNSTSTDVVTWKDTISDANLQAGEILYVTGGVYDNVAPPAYSTACAHRDRLVIAGLEDQYEWRSSAQLIKGEMLRFNEAWGGRVPADTGGIVAVASMDGNLFHFTSQAAYVVSGDGPDLLGNNPWGLPERVVSVDAGPISPQAVAATPMGILVRTVRGWKFLARDLSFQYVGADVEGYNAYLPQSVTVRPEIEEVWIQCDAGTDLQGGLLFWPLYNVSTGGIVLSYNYRFRQWAVLPNYGGQGACRYGGVYTRVRSDGAVLQESPSLNTDAGAHFPQVLETSWINVAGVQGFQRLRWVELLGAYGGPCTLSWEVAYDYNPTYAAADLETFSVGTQAAGTPVQLRRRLRIQKCEAVKFRFIVTTTTGTGAGLSLTDLSFELGVKRGAYKLPAGQSI